MADAANLHVRAHRAPHLHGCSEKKEARKGLFLRVRQRLTAVSSLPRSIIKMKGRIIGHKTVRTYGRQKQ